MFLIHRTLKTTKWMTRKVSNVCITPKLSLTFGLSHAVPVTIEDTVTKRSARSAPVRPKFSSHLGSDGESDGESFIDHQTSHFVTNLLSEAQESNGSMSSDTEPGILTAKQINDEVSK